MHLERNILQIRKSTESYTPLLRCLLSPLVQQSIIRTVLTKHVASYFMLLVRHAAVGRQNVMIISVAVGAWDNVSSRSALHYWRLTARCRRRRVQVAGAIKRARTGAPRLPVRSTVHRLRHLLLYCSLQCRRVSERARSSSSSSSWTPQCHIKMSPPWKIRPERDNRRFGMSPFD